MPAFNNRPWPFLLTIALFFALVGKDVNAQTRFIHKREQQQAPAAQWIGSSETNGCEYAVLLFRKDFDLEAIPETFNINISADNRYELYINGTYVHRGPAFGSLERWFYDTLDISDYLLQGANVVTVKVWNFGNYNAQRQQSAHTALILQAHDEQYAQDINTNDTWKVTRDTSYSPIILSNQEIGGGYIAYPSDSVRLKNQMPHWYKPGMPTRSWKKAVELGYGNEAGLNSWKTTEWNLSPRTIPIFPDSVESTFELRKSEGVPATSIKKLEVPAFSKALLLLDNKVLTMGYPVLLVSGGEGGNIRIRYQESLFDADNNKGHRDEIENKKMLGIYDSYSPTGKDSVSYTPLSLRTFRYVQLEIETGNRPLLLHDFYNRYAAFPFQKSGYFKVAKDSELTNILDASWRTARLCAHETYMDCPYYEQLQYIGDTRIQALISLYQTTSDELVTNALQQFHDSFTSIGLTQSRYPSDIEQIIPPFSLLYILMLHDYYMLREEPEFIADRMTIVPQILQWFIQYLDDNYLVTNIPYWNHTDGGAKGFEIGEPPHLNERPNAQLALLLAHSIDAFLEMCRTTHMPIKPEYYENISKKIKQNVYDQCFDSARGLLAESPQKEVFTEHTNALAILCDMPGIDARSIILNLNKDSSVIRATTYHSFYTFKAFANARMGHLLLEKLGPWQEALSLGLTTFPEHGTESRSDCHAWSAHLLYDLPAFVAGIQPAEKGFKKVAIQPQDVTLEAYSTAVQHPKGIITMNKRNPTTYEIELPATLTGTFQLGTKQVSLKSGMNRIKIE